MGELSASERDDGAKRLRTKCASHLKDLRQILAAYRTKCETAEAPTDAVPSFLADVYGSSSAGQDRCSTVARLLSDACDKLQSSGASEDSEIYIVRAPARVNLRGMHVDNNGGYCNSVCIDRELFIVFTVSHAKDHAPLLRLLSMNDTLLPTEVSVRHDASMDDLAAATGWPRYAYSAVLAAREHFGADFCRGMSLCGAIVSDFPMGAGLSSSHALVLCILNALVLVSNRGDQLDELSETLVSQKAEHLTGVKSGLMDQGSMIWGRKNSVLHARFYDLRTKEIPSTVQHCSWPSNAAIVVANSRVVRKLADARTAIEYALPRLGCAIALPILRRVAGERGLQTDDISQWTLTDTLSLLKEVPAEATLDELTNRFPSHVSEIKASVDRLIPGGATSLVDKLGSPMNIPLRGSTLFVLAESARAKAFFTSLVQGDLSTCGALMDVGHEGDAVDGCLNISNADLDALAEKYAAKGLPFIPGAFQAGHAKLDELCTMMRAEGVHDACLTGAGRGGCAIALFGDREVAQAAVVKIIEHFPDLGSADVFVATSTEGRGFFDLGNS
eukprot:TRINITY_DN14981_c0_g6_i1.p1 TRINITY_DN14981_c0_g6~~TRINITY_DN14981_c0_g6_i1.p1  ORF type:complete len:559 (-),score=67.39 TRINITY_DN14981_c0_g6_i1:147-1823(-)